MSLNYVKLNEIVELYMKSVKASVDEDETLTTELKDRFHNVMQQLDTDEKEYVWDRLKEYGIQM